MKTARLAALSTLTAAALAATWGVQTLYAQQADSIKRSVVQKHDLSAQGREGVMLALEFPPASAEVRHTHPGEVFAYVVDGALSLEVEGQPTVTAKTGDSFFIGAGKVHAAKNIAQGTTRVMGVLVVEKGKPISTPAK